MTAVAVAIGVGCVTGIVVCIKILIDGWRHIRQETDR